MSADPTPGSTNRQMELMRAAAERAVEFVESGMVLGLGAGRNAAFAIARIGALLRDNESPASPPRLWSWLRRAPPASR
jgi:hypothetical protein